MQYIFDAFTLDLDRGELTFGEDVVAVEPRAFSVLSYLVANSDRLISKDELIEKVWDGLIVSDAAISTVIKTARRAVNDDGATQKYIKTVHGRGFRFEGGAVATRRAVTSVTAESLVQQPRQATDPANRLDDKPSIAILPFEPIGISDGFAAISDAIPAELITSLSRLRWLKVVARGSSFRFRSGPVDLDIVRESLRANYCLSGTVEMFGPNLAVSVELSDTRSREAVWAERLSGKVDDVQSMRESLTGMVTSALELHIPQHEAALARVRGSENLSAWSYYHLALQHMYRFNRTDNALAGELLKQSTDLDPNFARAFAARSFVSFQSAFLRYGSERASDISAAQHFAEKSLELDPLDPFGSFNFGRSLWLRSDPAGGQSWLERSVQLSPNFAQASYALGWADAMLGNGDSAKENLSRAISLSPLDPFLYAMQSALGLALIQTGEREDAARWAVQGARKPGAHYLIYMIAAALTQIAGQTDAAAHWAKQALSRRPDASCSQFFAAFPFSNETFREDLRQSLSQCGFSD
ncbi:MAG: winged helix-turn-helix domain-containing protein [Alphaproteobacteria bacterium]|nr:winged helix-turn-helix domain-containing protein [Alphaproteobacteria bacterium]